MAKKCLIDWIDLGSTAEEMESCSQHPVR